MAVNLESAFRSTISHGALSAGIALSLAAVADEASAQQQRPQGQGGNVVLDTVDVEGRTAPADGDGAYAVQSASSPKQTAPLLDTPQTVTVIPQAIIQERGARNLTEVLQNTPGITFDAGENGFATSTNTFKLRGFDASGSIFIDGARDNGSYSRDTFNIERVEVFKGPAADNGRGSAGGYINMVTKSPILQNFIAGEVGFGFDEYDSKVRKRTTLDTNYVVAPTTAIRINGMWEDGGVAGREVAENNSWGFAPSITFGLGTNARAIFSYEHLTRRDLPDWGIPAHAMKGMGSAINPRYDPAIAAQVSRDNFYGLRSDFDDVDSDTVLARFEYDFSKTSRISNQTRWSRVDRTSRFTPLNSNPFANPCAGAALPAGSVCTQGLFYGRENTTLTNLTNYSTEFFTGTFKHNVSMGVELSREESAADSFAAASPAPGSTSLSNPNPDRVPGSPLVRNGWNKAEVNTVAAYLYDTIELSRHWEFTGGLRVERYNVSLSGSANPGFDDTQTTLGGKVGLVYKPVENGSFYVSYGLSHLPPGSYLSNEDISRDGGGQAFPGLLPGTDPVRMQNYEVGVKWDFFGGRLQTTAALFRTEKRVPITGRATVGGPAPDILLAYGQQIVQGLELGIAGNLTDRWKVFGGALFLDSERKHNPALDPLICSQSTGDCGGGTTARLNGDELAFTPRFSGNLWTTYRFDNRWTLGGGVQYVGSSYVGRPDNAQRIVDNGVYGKLPAYFLAHLMASYEIRKDAEIRFNVDNIFDKTYAVSTNWPAQRVTLGAPRTYRVSASFKY